MASRYALGGLHDAVDRYAPAIDVLSLDAEAPLAQAGEGGTNGVGLPSSRADQSLERRAFRLRQHADDLRQLCAGARLGFRGGCSRIHLEDCVCLDSRPDQLRRSS